MIKKSNYNSVAILIALIITLGISLTFIQKPTQINSNASTDKLFCTSLATNLDSGIIPLTTKLSLSGYASKGSGIFQYRFVFGDGSADVISATPVTTHTYNTPGTFVAKGFVVDKQGNQIGGIGNCQKNIIVKEGNISVDKTYVSVTLDAKNTIKDLLFGTGISITSEGATGWQIKYNEPTQGQGFYESSGSLVVGRTVYIRTFINTIKGDGVYSGSVIVQYYKNGVWSDGPTVSYTITLVNSPYITTGSLKVDKTDVNVTLNRSQALNGMIYGPGFLITSEGATGWQIKYNEPTQGQGFETSSGGLTPNTPVKVRTYINTNKPNGIYTGSVVVQYSKDGVWNNGPTVNYTITLTD